MTAQEALEAIKPSIEKAIKSNKLHDGLTMETNLFNAGLDSLGVMELLVDIENRFQIVFDDNELSPDLFERVGVLLDKILAKQGARLQ
jgi:acyl carrier protein